MSGMVQNLGADPGQWEILESKRGQDLERALYALPAFADTFVRHYPDAPVFMKEMPWAWMVCPRGHRVVKVELSVDHNWHLSLVAAAEDAEVTSGWQRVEGATWTTTRRAQQVCSTPGCPAIVSTLYCSEHDADPWGTVTNDVHENRLKVNCEECSFSGTYRHSRLLARFAVTVASKKKTMRLPT